MSILCRFQRVYFRHLARTEGGFRHLTRQNIDASIQHSGPQDQRFQIAKLKEIFGQDFEPDFAKAHIFDGKILHRDIANYQLCDVTDQFLVNLIHQPKARQDTLDVSRDAMVSTIVVNECNV